MQDGSYRELYVGDIIGHSIADGMQVDYHIFPQGYYRDLGTWDKWDELSGDG
jgi:hypothetical protein